MGKKKIVIIDDEEDLCQLMKSYLVELDYDVFLANTLASGIKLMHTVSPNIVFVDNNLPDGLGWEQINYLIKEFPECKINLISAYKYQPPDLAPGNLPVMILEKPLSLKSLQDYL